MEIKRTTPRRADETPIYIGAHQIGARKDRSSPGGRPVWIKVEPLEAGPWPPPTDGEQGCPEPLHIAPTRPPRRDETPRVAYYTHRPQAGGEMPIRLGEWLVRRGLLSTRNLFSALSYAQAGGMRIGDAIVAQGLLGRGQVELEALQHHTFFALYGGEPLATCPP